jgi:hypothetical protein
VDRAEIMLLLGRKGGGEPGVPPAIENILCLDPGFHPMMPCRCGCGKRMRRRRQMSKRLILLAVVMGLVFAAQGAAYAEDPCKPYYEKGYDQGLKDGYEDGYKDQYQKSYDDAFREEMKHHAKKGCKNPGGAYKKGYKKGYQKGYKKGKHQAKKDAKQDASGDAKQFKDDLRKCEHCKAQGGKCVMKKGKFIKCDM